MLCLWLEWFYRGQVRRAPALWRAGDCFSNFKCAFARALYATFGILQPMPFPRLQVGRKTPVLRPTCDLQWMRWNRTIYFSRTFSCHRNARSELIGDAPSLPKTLIIFCHTCTSRLVRPIYVCARGSTKWIFSICRICREGGPDPALQRAGARRTRPL
jgi:hypothetical protein